MAAETIERAPAGDAKDDVAEGKSRAGRVLDVAGVCAAVVLGVILVDIFSGGKLTRWARARRGDQPGDGPCQGCGDD